MNGIFVKLITNDKHISITFDQYKKLSNRSYFFETILDQFDKELIQNKELRINVSGYLFDKYWILIHNIPIKCDIGEIVDLFIFVDEIEDKQFINNIIPKLLINHEQIDPFLNKLLMPEISKKLNKYQIILLMEVYPYLYFIQRYIINYSHRFNSKSVIYSEIYPKLEKDLYKYHTVKFYNANFLNEIIGEHLPEFEILIKISNLNVIKWYATKFKITKNDILNYDILGSACSRGNLVIIKWLIENFNFNENDINNRILWCSTISGNLDVLIWLKEKFRIDENVFKENDNCIFIWASIKGYLEILKWLNSNFKITEKEAKSQKNKAFKWAAINGHFDVFSWLQLNFPYKENDIYNIDLEGYKDLNDKSLKILIKDGVKKVNLSGCNNITEDGLYYLQEKGVEIIDITNCFNINNKCLTYLIEKGITVIKRKIG